MNRLKKKNRSKRAKTPTVIQMEAVECGAAALSIVMSHYGRYEPLEKLRVACGVTRDGVNAKNILRAARSYGMEAKGFTKEIKSLFELQFPVIIYWNFNHFLVLEGFSDDGVYLNDPASGPRVVSDEEFEEAYTGVVLVLEPSEAFEKGGSPPGFIEPLRKRLVGSEIAVAFAVIAGLALVFPGLVIPIFSKIFIDNYLIKGMDHWVKPLLLGMAVTGLMRFGLSYLREYYLLRLETKLAVSTSSQFLWHVLRLPVDFYSQRFAGEISSRVALNDQIAQLLSGRLATTAIDVVMVIFYAALMLMYDPTLTLLGLVAVGVNLLTMKKVERKRTDGNRRLLQEQGKFVGVAMGGLQNMESIKSCSGESDFFAKMAGYQAKLINAQQDMALQSLFLTSIPPLMSTLTNITVLVLGGYRVMQGDLTMGMLVAFQSLMSSFLAPVNNLVNLGAELQVVKGSMNRLDDVTSNPLDPQTVEANGKVKALNGSDRLSGHLELKNLTFGYSQLADPLVDGFDLTLNPGTRVALVGSSGCGKSTVSKIVAGLYDPWEGEVLFDGKPRVEISRDVMASSLAVVDQDIILFEGTIRDNLTMWDQTVSEVDLIQACKDALIHDDIVARTGGYDSEVGEGGVNFSGGQRQRLEIARALVNNPPILVLDEATSALDTVSERVIDENLRKRGCTCLIVAHRLSSIRDCDEIIVLELGKVIERGPHDELLKIEDGLYTRLMHA